MTTRNLLLSLLFLLTVSCALGDKGPNIVIVLSDDLGYGSVGCYGADPRLIHTPNIDRLAREGLRFTGACTPSSVCTPTRYGLLTGRYCWRSRLKFEVANVRDPLLIETTRPTVASLLKSHGYRCAAIGKWHLGFGTTTPVDYTRELKPGPLELGFEYFFGIPQNNGDMTGVYVENHQVAGLRSTRLLPNPGTTHYGSTYMGLDAPQRDDARNMPVLTDKALAWLGQVPKDAPFFLYFAANSVHEPITPSPEVKGSSAAGPYGDFIHDLDRTVGLLMQAVERRGVADNTLFIFTSDNGGVVPRAGGEGKNPSIVQAAEAGLKICGSWRGRKHSVYEGGFRVPLVMRWPAKVKPGSTCDEMVNLVDIYATVSELIGEPLPDATKAAEDSFSFAPVIRGESTTVTRESMVVHSAKGNFAIRQGPWKYIEGKPHPDVKPGALKVMAEEYTPQLYNLHDDPQETSNVLAQHPEKVRQLTELLNRLRDQGHSR